jgi:dCTP deaminase
MLSNTKIQKAIQVGDIAITPYTPDQLGVNSYDLRLSNHIAKVMPNRREAVDKNGMPSMSWIDPYSSPVMDHYEIDEDGFLLKPYNLYLASTLEYTYTSSEYVPMIVGKSSIGRIGLSIHQTAGLGDAGFAGHWTLELSVIIPVRIYRGMPIAQIFWHELNGKADPDYASRKSSSYHNQSIQPVPSQLHTKHASK